MDMIKKLLICPKDAKKTEKAAIPTDLVVDQVNFGLETCTFLKQNPSDKIEFIASHSIFVDFIYGLVDFCINIYEVHVFLNRQTPKI